MPIYEEKLICPLAIRFTQDHIRTTFRDGRQVEAAVEEIGTKPGIGEYDLILDVPFPNIEILRWCVPRQDADVTSETSCAVGTRPREHWFTLDNRRLYCLQSAASAHWPARCAAVVEILYADSGSVRKKFDSTACGWSVAIGHSYEEPPICRWDWRERVLPLEVRTATEPQGVLGIVIADDRKRAVSALLDAPAKPSSLTDLVQGPATHCGGSAPSGTTTKTASGKGSCATPSTREGSEASDVASGGCPTLVESARLGCSASVEARNDVDAYDPVVANAIREVKEQLNIRENEGRVNIPHWNDRYRAALGSLREFLESRPDKFTVVPGADGHFTVVKARKRNTFEGRGESTKNIALRALAEIEEQLNTPNHDGRISMARWSERYEDVLGSLRSFVKSWPDKFTVIPGEGRHFRVVKKSDGMAMQAIREIEEHF